MNIDRCKIGLSALIVGVLVLPALVQSQPKAKPSWILQVLNKSKAEVDKVLGKPVAYNKEDMSGTYKRSGFKSVGVAFYGKGGKSLVVEVIYSKAPASWADALKQVGLSSAKVQATRTPANNGFDLKAVAGVPKGWEVSFIEASEVDNGESTDSFPAQLSIYGPGAS